MKKRTCQIYQMIIIAGVLSAFFWMTDIQPIHRISATPQSSGLVTISPIAVTKSIVNGAQVGNFQSQDILVMDGISDVTNARIVNQMNYSVQECAGYVPRPSNVVMGNLNSATFLVVMSNSQDFYFELYGFPDRPSYMKNVTAIAVESSMGASSFISAMTAVNLRISAVLSSNLVHHYMINPAPIKNQVQDSIFSIDSNENVKNIFIEMDNAQSCCLALDYLKISYIYNRYDLDCIYTLYFADLQDPSVNMKIRFANHPHQTKIEVLDRGSWALKTTLQGYGPSDAVFTVPASCYSSDNSISIRVSADRYDGYDRPIDCQNIAIDQFLITTDDIVPPQIEILEPSNPLYGNNTPEIVCSVSDLHPNQDQVRLQVGNNVFQLEKQLGTGSAYRLYSQSPDWQSWNNYYSALPSGPITLCISAVDMGGNIGTAFKTIQLDKTAPYIEFVRTNLSNNFCGEYAPKIFASFSDEHKDRIEFSFLSQAYQFMLNSDNSYEFNASCNGWDHWNSDWDQIPSGSYSILVTAYDTMGNYRNFEMQLIKDVESPIMFILGSDGETYSIQPPSLKTYAYDVNLAEVLMEANGSSFAMTYNEEQDAFESSEAFHSAWLTMSDGLYNVTIFASDYAGHETQATRWIYKDTVKPFLTCWVDNAASSQPPKLNIESSDLTTYIHSIYYTFEENPAIDSNTWVLGYSGNNVPAFIGQISISPSVWNRLPDGFYSISVLCYDTAFNYQLYSPVGIQKDTLGPAFTVQLNQSCYEQAPAFAIYMEECYHSIWYQIKGINYTISHNGSLNQEAWDSLAYSPQIPIPFYSNDSMGNVRQVTMYIEKRNSAPSFLILLPKLTYSWEEEVTISISIVSGIADSVYVMLNGSTVLLDALTFTFRPKDYCSEAGGTIDLVIFGNNSYDISSSTLLSVHILPKIGEESKSEKNPSEFSPTDLAIIGASASITLFISYIRRNPPRRKLSL